MPRRSGAAIIRQDSTIAASSGNSASTCSAFAARSAGRAFSPCFRRALVSNIVHLQLSADICRKLFFLIDGRFLPRHLDLPQVPEMRQTPGFGHSQERRVILRGRSIRCRKRFRSEGRRGPSRWILSVRRVSGFDRGSGGSSLVRPNKQDRPFPARLTTSWNRIENQYPRIGE